MSKSNHTHRGHCQVCGAIQAMDNTTKRLAKHGYTVKDFGYFVGVCSGAHNLPMELERKLTDLTIVSLERYAEEQSEYAAKLLSGAVKPARARTDTRDDSNTKLPFWQRPMIEVDFETAEPHFQQRTVNEKAGKAKSNASQARVHAGMLTRLVDVTHGKAPIPAVDTRPTPVLVRTGMKFNSLDGVAMEVIGRRGERYWDVKNLTTGRMQTWSAIVIKRCVRAKGA